ncbi:hypothetical protein KIN20_036640 [Parelaphostrongylus tenuis]|uniref:Uncharacterized protein n=1 Tax=Parelaphostrongylus tenuis TaxID=148309 RepID=A0AAD5WKQ9_PARTN|nr:hypothetical protein KIN20_036640 [Parelaphostrongylus tenuis]
MITHSQIICITGATNAKQVEIHNFASSPILAADSTAIMTSLFMITCLNPFCDGLINPLLPSKSGSSEDDLTGIKRHYNIDVKAWAKSGYLRGKLKTAIEDQYKKIDPEVLSFTTDV